MQWLLNAGAAKSVLLLLLFLFYAWAGGSLQQAEEKTQAGCARKRLCLVAGCENRIRGKRFDDMRINFGITNLISARLHESGCVRLVEEKSDVREKLDRLRGPLWNRGGKKVVQQIRQLQDSAAIVIGRLVYFGTPRTDMGFGPFHMSRGEVVIKIEVDCMYPDGERITGNGKGKASRRAMSTMYQYRDDRVLFDQSDIGKATAAAVQEAVNELVLHHKERMAADE